MGGDQLIGSLCGEEADARMGDQIRDAEKDLYMELIDEVAPLPHARDLIEELKRPRPRGRAGQLGEEHEVDHYLDLLDVRELVDGWTTSADVERTKPHPDLVAAGVEKAGGGDAVMVGRLDMGLHRRGACGVPPWPAHRWVLTRGTAGGRSRVRLRVDRRADRAASTRRRWRAG